jgi:hypothetical protein
MHIANDSPGNNHTSSAANALKEAESDQDLDIACQRTADARNGEEPDAHIERCLAAPHIGDGPIEKLGNRKWNKEGQKAHLHGIVFRAKVLSDGRHRGKIHINRKGTDGGQQAEDEGTTKEGARHDGDLSENRGAKTGLSSRQLSGGIQTDFRGPI